MKAAKDATTLSELATYVDEFELKTLCVLQLSRDAIAEIAQEVDRQRRQLAKFQNKKGGAE